MKLERRLYIGGKAYPIIKTDNTLQLNSIGRAVFTVKSSTKPSGVVSYQAGYTTGDMYPVFLGLIKSAEKRDALSWVVSCREISEALRLPCPVSLRNCTLKDVTADISKTIGLNLLLPSAAYTSAAIPRFANTTDALTAVQNIGRSFGITDYVWYQQPDGAIWLGQQADSDHAKQGNIAISDSFFTKQKSGMATLPALPALRPGMIINNKTIDTVRLIEMETQLSWSS